MIAGGAYDAKTGADVRICGDSVLSIFGQAPADCSLTRKSGRTRVPGAGFLKISESSSRGDWD